MSKTDEINQLKNEFPTIIRYEAGEAIELTGEEYENHIEELWQLNKKQEEKIAQEQAAEEARLAARQQAEAKLLALGLTTEDLKALLS